MAVERGSPTQTKRPHWSPTLFKPSANTKAATRTMSSGSVASASDLADQWTRARWRRESRRVAPFIVVLVLLEGANWYLLEAAFGWVLPGRLLPGLAALALLIVLIGTVFASSLLGHRDMRAHQRRLRVTLAGLIALQFMVNTVQGFDMARAHMPVSAAQFFGLDPLMMARVVGAVMGGSLALITFSYLLVVATVVDKIVSPVNMLHEVNLLLGQYDDASASATPGVQADRPTVDIGRGQWPTRDHSNEATEIDPGAWAIPPR